MIILYYINLTIKIIDEYMIIATYISLRLVAKTQANLVCLQLRGLSTLLKYVICCDIITP